MQPFVLIVGPTASGKSALALNLAEKFNGAVLNCDSIQTYERLNIGAAKPSKQEMAQVPHFLFDVIAPGEVLTAGDFRQMALSVLQRELPHRPVFGVGGSGFYIQALEKGMFDVPKPKPEVEARVRAHCEILGPDGIHAELMRLDPEYGETINPRDAYRIIRALVIIADSGKKVSQLRAEFQPQPFPYPMLKLGLAPSREQLLPRVTRRTEAMLSAGLLDEVQSLLDEGLGAWPALQSVGYKECLQFLNGEIEESKLLSLINEKTLQLAKKQRTWFKRDPDIHWLPSGADEGKTAQNAAEAILARFLDSLA